MVWGGVWYLQKNDKSKYWGTTSQLQNQTTVKGSDSPLHAKAAVPLLLHAYPLENIYFMQPYGDLVHRSWP